MAAVAAPYALLAGTAVGGFLPWSALVAASAFSFVPGRSFLAFAQDTHLDAERVKPLKRYAIKWHTAFGVGFSLALVAARRYS